LSQSAARPACPRTARQSPLAADSRRRRRQRRPVIGRRIGTRQVRVAVARPGGRRPTGRESVSQSPVGCESFRIQSLGGRSVSVEPFSSRQISVCAAAMLLINIQPASAFHDDSDVKVSCRLYALFHWIFSARCNYYTSRAYATMSVSVCLSVTKVHWHIIANLLFKFRSKFTSHCRRGEGSSQQQHLALC